MFTLTLLRFSPISKETHLVAVVLAFLTYIVDNMAMPSATATSSFTTALIGAICWYGYKVFDGLTYDGAETVYGPMAGFTVAVSICVTYFLL